MGSVTAERERHGTGKHLPGGKFPGSRDVIREGVEMKTRTVVGGRIQKPPCDPLQCRALSLSKPPCLLSQPPKPLSSGLWAPSHEPPPLQQSSSRARGQLSGHISISLLQITGAQNSTARQCWCLGGGVHSWGRVTLC